MIIRNGLVWGNDFAFHEKDLYIDDATHTIVDKPVSEHEEILDAKGNYVIPGLVDVHIHGAKGHDFCDANTDALSEIAAYLHSCGVTSFCATSMTLPENQLMEIFETVSGVPDDGNHAYVAGIHMEGPFLSPAKNGAQKESYLCNPSIDVFRRLSEVFSGKIRLITIAPELPGADKFIEKIHDEVAISLGHSTASYEIASKAFAAGASHATHLFNAMPAFHHRDPGIVGAAADAPHTMVEIICDGIHIHPAVIRSVFRIFGDDRVILISDAMRATGMADGTYELGGQTVYKKGRFATLPRALEWRKPSAA
ncbi:N-acetylglucosamine-6-phosphate deacetylase [Roseburia sp. AF15-21]|uniref:N-acetylglucosamine-6-phosphate deacetylase n=2 Tax=Roseburia TaxID=841 RepID=UPI001FAACC32|nr:N-acetylglucosamine-6-phosphate deacetylase [Roseburia sp. AF15-21]